MKFYFLEDYIYLLLFQKPQNHEDQQGTVWYANRDVLRDQFPSGWPETLSCSAKLPLETHCTG